MYCPACKKHSSNHVTLESGLQALQCTHCNGYWIKSFQYWKWKEKNPGILAEKAFEEGLDLPVEDSKAGKICPECNKILFRYKVGHGLDFNLDRCNTCGGTWFDVNEWEILKSRNLHDEIHFIFSAPWQVKVRKEEQEINKEKQLKNKIGEQDYLKVKEIKDWLKKHTNQNVILAYIKDAMK